MYCIRLIAKEGQLNENNIFEYDQFVIATHLKIKDDILYLLNPVANTANGENGFPIDIFSHFIINHYQIYTIDEVKEAYKRIIGAYSTLSQSATYLKDYDNDVSIFELVETMYSTRIDSITSVLLEKKKEHDKQIKKNQTTINKEGITNEENNS